VRGIARPALTSALGTDACRSEIMVSTVALAVWLCNSTGQLDLLPTRPTPLRL
jgi:hypothetical protein